VFFESLVQALPVQGVGRLFIVGTDLKSVLIRGGGDVNESIAVKVSRLQPLKRGFLRVVQ
jgi:hypothetical protein